MNLTENLNPLALITRTRSKTDERTVYINLTEEVLALKGKTT